MKTGRVWLSAARRLVPVVLLSLAAGYGIRWCTTPVEMESLDGDRHVGADRVSTRWTCSMHPQIQRDEPGSCPLCGMDLVPLDGGVAADASSRELLLTPQALALMDLQVHPVERRFVATEVRMVGKLDYDETRLSYITAWVPGRLDRLYVDYTGVEVQEDDHLVYLYSPELFSAQEELLQALRNHENYAARDPDVRQTSLATLEASRERLRKWGLTPAQVAAIEESGTASDHITIYAPISGIVIHRNAQQGMYVETGTRIYTIADLSRLWLKLDAYESDLPWLRFGQRLEFTTEAYPGEVFEGTISFINPVVDSSSRTVKIRVNVDNSDRRLKPEMFVRAVVQAQVAASGRVIDPDLRDKWICPMHPEVIKPEAGQCDRCEMDLVPTEELGFSPVEGTEPLVIPASAPLITGERAVVYVRVPDATQPTFEGREVILGPRAGDWYIVESGLEEGELVVTKGNFKIDSALQIQARPSMMQAQRELESLGYVEAAQDLPASARADMSSLWDAYHTLLDALVAEDAVAAREAGEAVGASWERFTRTELSDPASLARGRLAPPLDLALEMLDEAADVTAQRVALAATSEALFPILLAFGADLGPLYKVECPMAFDGAGAHWLQREAEIRNPYHGSRMLRCGEVVTSYGTDE